MARPIGLARRNVYRRASQVLWTPLNLGSTLLAWWDPRQGLTMNGSNVSAWADRVGGLSASQSTASAQPGYSSTARNGTPGLTFSGQRLTGTQSFPAGSSPSTIAASAYRSSTDSNARVIFQYGTWGNLGARAIGVNGGNVGGFLYAGDVQGGAYGQADHFVMFQVDPSQQLLFTDGTQLGTGSSTPNTSSSGFTIGDVSNVSAAWVGTIQHIYVTLDLTASQRRKLGGYDSWISGKNGSNLSSSDPYATRPPYVSDP